MSFESHRRLAAVAVIGGLLAATRPGLADPVDVSRLHWIFDGAVQASARIGDVLYVGGTFQAVAPSANVVPPLYALAAGSGALAGPTFPVASGSVSAVLPDGVGGYYLAGSFLLTGATTPTAVAHVLSNGSADPGFTQVPVGTAAGLTRIGGTLYVVGSFSVPAPRVSAAAIAVSAVDGALVASWVPALGALVPRAIIAGDDRIVVVGDTLEPFIASGSAAAFDLVSGAELWRTNVAPGGFGSADRRSAWAAVRDGARVLVAHSPSAINGGLSVVSLATGTIDTSWNPQVSPQVMAISGGVLYVGGFFSAIAGQPRSSLAAIDLATASLLPWNVPGPTAPIIRMAPSTTGGVFVSGLFNTIGGTARWRVAEIDAAGAVTPWVAATRPEQPYLLAPGAGGALIVSSTLTATGYVPRSRLAAFDLTTGALLPWAPVANGPVDVLGAAPGRVTVGGRFTTIDGQPAASGAALDAATGTRLSWTPTAPGVAVFSDGQWVYHVAGPQPAGPFVTERYSLATGTRDPSWTVPGSLGRAHAVDGDVLYVGSSAGVGALDRRTARLRWSNPGLPATALAVSGDTLYAYGYTGLATYDARTGARMTNVYGPSAAQSAAVVDGRLLATEGTLNADGSVSALIGRRLDGTVSTWAPGVTQELIGGPSDTIAAFGDVVVAGGIFGARAPQALQGLAVFDRRGSPAPAALRARPAGALTAFTWDPPAQAPAGGYVLEAGVQPGQVAAALPLGPVTRFSTVVPPGTYYVRVRTAGAAGGVEEVSNEIVVSGGCTAPPASPARFRAVLFGAALDSATFAWDAPDALVSTYTLVAGSAPGRADIASIPFSGGGTLFTYASAIPPGSYYLRIRAANACGTSADSNELRLTIGAGDLPLSPLGLTVSTAGGATTLTWTPVPGAIGYVLEAGSDVGLSDLAAVPLGPSAAFSVPPVPGGVYVLRVRAVNAAGTSGPSNEVVLRVP